LAWLLLFSGNGLFALAMPPLAIFILISFWLSKKYRHLFNEIASAEKLFNWKQEIGILHKRVAVSWLSNYLFLHIPTPIIFYFLGPEKAGQFGISITIANVLASIGTSKIASIIPKFSHLVQEQDFKNADNLFMKNFWVCIKFSLGATILVTLIAYLTTSIPMLQRLLPWNELLILLLALVSFHGANIMASYFRAYGKELMSKFNLISTVTSLLIFYSAINNGLFFGALFILAGLGLMFLTINLYFKNSFFQHNLN
jgi:O-antigen/teichoic acid export membrane protein